MRVFDLASISDESFPQIPAQELINDTGARPSGTSSDRHFTRSITQRLLGYYSLLWVMGKVEGQMPRVCLGGGGGACASFELIGMLRVPE